MHFIKMVPNCIAYTKSNIVMDGVSAFYGGPGIMADELKRVFPEVQFASNYAWNGLSTFEANNKIIKESGNHAGQDFFKMFSYPLLAGQCDDCIKKPSDIAISKKMAKTFLAHLQKQLVKQFVIKIIKT